MQNVQRRGLGHRRCEFEERGQIVRQFAVEVIPRIEEELLVAQQFLGLLAEIRAVVRGEIEVRVLREVKGTHIRVLELLPFTLADVTEELLEYLTRLRTLHVRNRRRMSGNALPPIRRGVLEQIGGEQERGLYAVRIHQQHPPGQA